VAGLPLWATWILAPRSRAAAWLDQALWPFAVLCAVYAGLLVVGFTSGGAEGAGYTTLAGVQAIFASPWGAVTGWVHYLAFDLFVARWIRNDATDPGYALSPILVGTLLFGPAGLLTYLLLRGRLR